MSHPLYRLGLLLLVLAWSGVVHAQPGDALPEEPREYKPTKVESELIKRINAERMRVEKPALAPDATLNRIAHEHARQMAIQETLSHVLGESRPETRLREAGYEHRGFAENVAYGYPTPQAAVVGVGAYREPGGPWYYCAIFGLPVENPAAPD
jgi:uncharacterized protein YkwD